MGVWQGENFVKISMLFPFSTTQILKLIFQPEKNVSEFVSHKHIHPFNTWIAVCILWKKIQNPENFYKFLAKHFWLSSPHAYSGNVHKIPCRKKGLDNIDYSMRSRRRKEWSQLPCLRNFSKKKTACTTWTFPSKENGKNLQSNNFSFVFLAGWGNVYPNFLLTMDC